MEYYKDGRSVIAIKKIMPYKSNYMLPKAADAVQNKIITCEQ